jgi:solute carrier family 50 protein (sugar transporter)
LQAQDLLTHLMLGGASLFLLMGLIGMAAGLSPAAKQTLWGATCVAVLGVYYVAPLSSVAQVVAQRDSSSLHWPLCTMNVINGMLWFAYGLALKDWFICLPVSGWWGARGGGCGWGWGGCVGEVPHAAA